MDAFLLAAGLTAVAEVGDRSLLLALLLGSRYSRTTVLFLGMSTGLILNLVLVGLFGSWLFLFVPTPWQPWIVSGLFMLTALWLLQQEGSQAAVQLSDRKLFVTSASAFFIMEMADKSQLTMLALVGSQSSLPGVILGAICGTLAVVGPALWLGRRLSPVLPSRWLSLASAALFFLAAGSTLALSL